MFIEALFIFFLGLLFGSFSSALIYRVPSNTKWWGRERSRCPSCNNALTSFDLIPVFSWCLHGGKCRQCKASVSWHYPALEIVSGFACVGIYLNYGLTLDGAFILLTVPFLLSLFVIDLKHMILPNQLVLILFLFGVLRLVYLIFTNSGYGVEDILFTHVLGAFLYALIPLILSIILNKVLKKESLGFGDVKFFFVAGLWLGINVFQYFMIVSGALAIAFSVFWKMLTKQEVFPFGPALILTFYILLLFQGSILH